MPVVSTFRQLEVNVVFHILHCEPKKAYVFIKRHQQPGLWGGGVGLVEQPQGSLCPAELWASFWENTSGGKKPDHCQDCSGDY